MDEFENIDETSELNEKQKAFCREYCLDFNVSKAGIRAGFSPHSAAQHCHNLYQKPKIRAEIKRLLQERRIEYDVTVDRLQTEVARIAFADITDIFEALSEDGRISLQTLKELPPKVKAAIRTIRPTKFGIEVVFHDKIGALEMLAKHFGYFEKDNKQKVQEGVAVYLPDNGRDDRGDTFIVSESEIV